MQYAYTLTLQKHNVSLCAKIICANVAAKVIKCTFQLELIFARILFSNGFKISNVLFFVTLLASVFNDHFVFCFRLRLIRFFMQNTFSFVVCTKIHLKMSCYKTVWYFICINSNVVHKYFYGFFYFMYAKSAKIHCISMKQQICCHIKSTWIKFNTDFIRISYFNND